MKNIHIGKKYIGDGSPTFVVAEIGINHNGDIDIAKRLIDSAIDANCDAVKFQKREPDICVPNSQKKVMKETPWGNMSYLAYKKRIEFGIDEYIEIDKYCKKRKIMWFASCWDKESVDFIERFKPSCYKIPSACLTNDDLLLYIASKNRPIILSTGMSTIEQINKAVNLLRKNDLVIMHCNSTYPLRYENYNKINLSVIEKFKGMYNCPVGYGGYETGIFPTVLSVVLGANCVERHITLDRAMWGTDHSASLEPVGLKRMVRDIRLIPILKGDGIKKVYDEEKEVLKKLRG